MARQTTVIQTAVLYVMLVEMMMYVVVLYNSYVESRSVIDCHMVDDCMKLSDKPSWKVAEYRGI